MMTPKYESTLPSGSGAEFNPAEHLPLAVYFCLKDSTPGCTAEGLDFSTQLEQFEKPGYTVIGIPCGDVKSYRDFCIKQGFRFELLSDKDETVCKLFDVVKLKKLYDKESFGAEHNTFVLSIEGEIMHEWRKAKVDGHTQKVLETLGG